jgi:hypothetical protein
MKWLKMLKKSWDGLKVFWIERFKLSANAPENQVTGKLEKRGGFMALGFLSQIHECVFERKDKGKP